jgi:hypothetical protein
MTTHRSKPTHKGLPRTSSHARQVGKKVARPKSAALISFSSVGRRSGSICDVHDGTVPGTKIVCYWDEGTGQCTDCHQVPA